MPDLALASCVSFVLILLNMLFGGFYVAIERVPRWIRWLKYTSYLYWAYTGMLSNQFAGQTLACEAASHPNEFGGCPFSGDEVVRGRGAGHFSVGVSIGMLLSFTAFFRTLAYVVRHSLRPLHRPSH